MFLRQKLSDLGQFILKSFRFTEIQKVAISIGDINLFFVLEVEGAPYTQFTVSFCLLILSKLLFLLLLKLLSTQTIFSKKNLNCLNHIRIMIK